MNRSLRNVCALAAVSVSALTLSACADKVDESEATAFTVTA